MWGVATMRVKVDSFPTFLSFSCCQLRAMQFLGETILGKMTEYLPDDGHTSPLALCAHLTLRCMHVGEGGAWEGGHSDNRL
jgi:hypothetical protein